MASITKRGDNYRIKVSDGYDARGKQIVRSMTWTPEPGMTDRQIEKALNRVAVLFEESKAVKANIKFETFARECFFPEWVQKNLKEKTREKYERLSMRTYKAIGHLRMDKITKRHIQTFISNLEEPGINQVTKDKLSVKSIKDYLSFVSSVFSYAIYLEMLTDNPCRGIRVSGKRSIGQKPPADKCYTLEEAQKFVNLLQNEPPIRQAFFTLAILGGFRKGEILGLKWEDVDFSSCLISIQREAAYTTEKGHYIDTPKTLTSVRTLRLPQEVFDVLKSRRKEQNTDRLKAGDRWNPNGLIFTTAFGEPLGDSSMYNWLVRFCEKTGMRRVSIHSFRHLNATLLINSGADIKTVSSLLGHSQTSTTLNIYTHALEEAKARASEAVANAIGLNKASKQ